MLARLIKDERGATAIEYALIGALVSLGAITTMELVGTSVTGLFVTVSGDLAGAAAGTGGSGTGGGT